MRRALLLAAVPAAALLAAGCVSLGRPFDESKVSTIVVGQTTRGQIHDAFGDPYRTGSEDGDETWTFLNYRFGVVGPQRAKDLYVRFTSTGTVKSYSYNTN